MGAVNSVPTPGSFTPAVNTVTVPAGSMGVTKIDAAVVSPASNLLTIVFNGVSFSGGQFYLYLSQNGFASQSPGDVKYSPTFNTAQFTDAVAGTLNVIPSNGNGTFWIGTYSGNMIVVGPVPTLISSAYKFIKVFDGSTGAEAATTQQVIITPGITVSPAVGPALTPVTVRGGGFPVGKSVNINYTFPFYAFIGGALKTMKGVLISGQNTGSGWFTSATTPIVDAKQAYNPTTIANTPHTPITLFAVNASKVSSTLSNAAQFIETNRLFHQVEVWSPGGSSLVSNSGISTFGNDTGAAPILGGQPIKVYVFSPVRIVGQNFSISSPVTFWIGTTQLTSTISTTSSTGAFNTTLSIPVLASGTYTLVTLNDGVKYTFTIQVYPTIILSPFSGTASNPRTTVAVEYYGFPASITTYVYWNATSISSSTEYSVVNVTTNANGETNPTPPQTFIVPEAYGGPHLVTSFSAFHQHTFANSLYSGYSSTNLGSVFFTVLPSLVVCPGGVCPVYPATGSFNSTYASKGSGHIVAVGEGLIPNTYYSVNIDNQMADFALVKSASVFTEGAVTPNGYGVLNLTFIGAGFDPGVHVISMTSAQETSSTGKYAPDIYALFTVTPVGNWEYNSLKSINDSINGFTSSINTLSTNVHGWITSAVTSINSNTNSQIGTIATSISSAVTSINSHTDTQISALSTSIQGWINGAVTSINSHTDSALTTISSDVSSIMTTVGTTSTAVGGLSGLSTQATNIMNAVNTEQTYVLVVAVLAAIILVLVLAVLIRKLS